MNNPKNKILVISHANCDDGLGAALAAYIKYQDNADYWFAFYGAKPPWHLIGGRDVMIFDFTYSREDLMKIKEMAKSLIVIDHHKGAERVISDLDFCKFDMTKSGAVLAWEYLHGDKPYNAMFYHIQDYDLWKFECDNTKFFSKFLKSQPQTLEAWVKIYNSIETSDDYYKNTIVEGKVIERYYNAQLISAVSSTKQNCEINGVKGLSSNLTGLFASEAGSMLAQESGTFGMTYYRHSNGSIKCSLRSISDETDVDALAKPYGGGGHVRASGCTMTNEQLQAVLR